LLKKAESKSKSRNTRKNGECIFYVIYMPEKSEILLCIIIVCSEKAGIYIDTHIDTYISIYIHIHICVFVGSC